jgi:hypothetical protein
MNLSFKLISCDSDPLLESELSDIERVIGKLPEDYRHFLLHSNGGRTVHDELFFFAGGNKGDRFDVTNFTVIDPGFPPPVVTAKLSSQPRRLLAVAKSERSPFLMVLDHPDTGDIYFWEYELEEAWDAEEDGREYLPEDSTVIKVASSFTELVDNLTVNDRRKTPEPDNIMPSVENYAKYGDLNFNEAKAFLDALAVDELNKTWPKDGKYPHLPIHYAANWGQFRITEYLINRGVDYSQAFRYCTNSVKVTKLLLSAGATEEEMRQHLFSACEGLPATRVPEQKEQIIELLVDQGVQPDFSASYVREEWEQLIRRTNTKKILRYLLNKIEFPRVISDQIQHKLAQPE